MGIALSLPKAVACNAVTRCDATGPISLTDTHLEPSVSRTRPTITHERTRRRWKGLVQRDSKMLTSCLRANCHLLRAEMVTNGGHLEVRE